MPLVRVFRSFDFMMFVSTDREALVQRFNHWIGEVTPYIKRIYVRELSDGSSSLAVFYANEEGNIHQ